MTGDAPILVADPLFWIVLFVEIGIILAVLKFKRAVSNFESKKDEK